MQTNSILILYTNCCRSATVNTVKFNLLLFGITDTRFSFTFLNHWCQCTTAIGCRLSRN